MEAAVDKAAEDPIRFDGLHLFVVIILTKFHRGERAVIQTLNLLVCCGLWSLLYADVEHEAIDIDQGHR